DDGQYQLLAKSGMKASVVKNGKMIIQEGTIMSLHEKDSCPPKALSLRNDLLKSKSLKRFRQNGETMYKFIQDVVLPSDYSLHVIGSALYGTNRAANKTWKLVDANNA